MDDSRTDAPKFDLTAQPSEDEDVLQAEPADLSSSEAPAQKKKPDVKPTPPNPELDARLFNALVSPVAPVHMTERSASAPHPAPLNSSLPEPVADEPAPPEATQVDPTPPAAAPLEIVDPANDAFVDGPMLMVQPIEEGPPPTVHDWEPLPPLLRIVAGRIESDPDRTEDDPPASGVTEFQQGTDSGSDRGPEVLAKTWDPAAVEDRPELEMTPSAGALREVSVENPRLEAEALAPTLCDDDMAEAEETSSKDSEPAGLELAEPLPEPEPLLAASQDDLDPTPDSTPVFASAPDPIVPDAPPGRTGAWWTLPMMCLGLAIVACAILVPAADDNRRHLHELAKLERDVAYFQKQSEVNQQFLEHVSTDPTLAERLAQRQLRMTRADSRVVQMSKDKNPFAMSPYALVTIDPPAPMPEYQPMGGFLSRYFLDTKGQIYLTGLGILLVAAGVILGGGEPRKTSAG
jgi:cell division protein FtsL